MKLKLHQVRRQSRTSVAALCAVAIMASALLLSTGTAHSAQAAVATQPLLNYQSGRCLDVAGNVTSGGTLADIWDCNNQANQGWNFTSAGQIQVYGGTMCLDAVGQGTALGTKVDIWSCNGQANQNWAWGANNTLVGQQSGLCLDVDGSGTAAQNTANGRSVILWTCNSSAANQRWSNGGGADSATMTVDAATILHGVDRVGSNFLYGIADGTTPPASIIAPLKPTQFRQPPPNSQHKPNGSPVAVGDTLKVYPTVNAVGAHIIVDMPDSFDGFPYNWTSWSDWYSRIDSMVSALKANTSVPVSSMEPWNEPDWTWPSAAGSFTSGWALTVQRIKADGYNAPILGPSYSGWNIDSMRSFLTAAKASGTLPDVVSWHELSGWQRVTADVAAYRGLEAELGISPRPISIDEYATTSEIDSASSTNHYIAQFERSGVRDAERAFWYEAGTLDGLLHNGSPTASYWMYKWYADQTGNLVQVKPTTYQDGVASYNASAKQFSLVFGGASGNNSVKVTGISGIGTTVKAVVTHVAGSGRTTNVSGPSAVSSATYTVSGGAITVPVNNQDPYGAYNLVITAN